MDEPMTPSTRRTLLRHRATAAAFALLAAAPAAGRGIHPPAGAGLASALRDPGNGVDPLLGPLVELGPRQWAHVPLAGSPAVDAGEEALCTASDQTGAPRPRDGDGEGTPRCDLGAIEAGGLPFAAAFETGDTAEWSATVP